MDLKGKIMTEKHRLELTVNRIDEELQKWYATCPYNGMEEFFDDESHENWVKDLAEQVRDDHADQEYEQMRDERDMHE